ncbi:MAG: shikimate kinase [Candidatus Omnitrophica bacterium]|nr:shikimate kinase [Candidatus Omnitrophota bacterium]MCM8770348.1 shikimate kinase [Candidatus Omnitrophota bacterium]
MENIYLVGFMGTGKSAVGKKLAARLNVRFLDLDALIEEKEGRKIVDIFRENGEPYFRKLEKENLKEISTKDNLVVACGGGIVLDRENIALMKKTGRMVCLRARTEVILERVKRYKHRPLLNVEDKEKAILEILKVRQPLYDLAHFSIDTSDLSIEAVVEKILAHLNK